jgi:hypothetical protein
MVNQSGIHKQPSLLSLPRPIPIEDYDGIAGLFCYVIKHYGYSGVACLISRDTKQDQISIAIGDWKGNIVDLSDKKHALIEVAYRFIDKHGDGLTRLMHAIQLTQAIFYFVPKNNGEFILVDLRMSLNKFVGPGMLRDIFGSVVETQDVIEVAHLDEPRLKSIREGKGIYSGSLILKPSKYRSITVGNNQSPLYIEIAR